MTLLAAFGLGVLVCVLAGLLGYKEIVCTWEEDVADWRQAYRQMTRYFFAASRCNGELVDLLDEIVERVDKNAVIEDVMSFREWEEIKARMAKAKEAAV